MNALDLVYSRKSMQVDNVDARCRVPFAESYASDFWCKLLLLSEMVSFMSPYPEMIESRQKLHSYLPLLATFCIQVTLNYFCRLSDTIYSVVLYGIFLEIPGCSFCNMSHFLKVGGISNLPRYDVQPS